jgi:hypothetical protein
VASDNQNSFGISHLSNHPITVSFGAALIMVLIVLVILRVVFGEITVGAKAGAR